jgi:hypothetical protein
LLVWGQEKYVTSNVIKKSVLENLRDEVVKIEEGQIG